MEGKAAILYFSGTGNTAAVAGMLRDGLAASRSVDLIRIEDVTRGRERFAPHEYSLIGMGYPSYGFNVPRTVTDFAKSLDGSAENRVFLFLTCAGPCYINHIASLGLKRILRRRRQGCQALHRRR